MVKIKEKGGRSDLEFNLDGTLKFVELDVMNLNNMGMWEKVSKEPFTNHLFPFIFNQVEYT